MIPKVETCIYALERGVEGVVILDGKIPHAVLIELPHRPGFGYADHAVKAGVTDAPTLAARPSSDRLPPRGGEGRRRPSPASGERVAAEGRGEVKPSAAR